MAVMWTIQDGTSHNTASTLKGCWVYLNLVDIVKLSELMLWARLKSKNVNRET